MIYHFLALVCFLTSHLSGRLRVGLNYQFWQHQNAKKLTFTAL